MDLIVGDLPSLAGALPLYYRAMQFFQTPWGQRTGNFLEGVAEECVDGCTPAEALAGGAQEALFGEMLEGFPGLRRNSASSNDLFTPAEYQVFRGALDDFAAGRRNLQQVTPEEDALIRRAILEEHPQYLEEIQGSLNQALHRSIFKAGEEFGPEFEPGMRIRDAGNVILDYLDYTEKPEAAHTLSMAEAYDYYQKGEIEGFDEFGFGERLFNRTYEQVKAAGTLGVDQTAKGDYGLRIVRSGGRIMAVVSDYDIGYVKTGGRFLYTIEGTSDDETIGEFITRVNSNYGRNILQHPDHYTGMLEGLEGATVGRALSGEIMIYRHGETAPIIEPSLMRVLYKSLGANNIWQFSKLLSEQVPNTASPFFRVAWYEMLEDADRITSPP
jgi:hypothetical protein